MTDVPSGELADDDDLLDGTDVDYKADPVADEDLTRVILSPDDDPARLEEYRQLFGVDG